MADSVKVAVRVRPFKDYEIQGNAKCVVQMNGPQTILIEPKTGKENKFTFDYSYWSFNKSDANYADNQVLWNDLGEAMLANCWQGYNTSMFAYGQTGSGKSYSMVGYPGLDEGLIIKAGNRIFQKIEESKSQNDVPIEYTVEASMLEIYNEEIRDLFNPKNNPNGGLKIREDPRTGVYVEDLSKHLVADYTAINKLLEQGEKARTTGATLMNKTSSRAHTVFMLYFKQTVTHPETKQKVQKVSTINLIDLAGSERMARTGATGARAQEGININLSLTCLGNVIKALADKCSGKKPTNFIPYRDSKLTYLLKESLGGNSKTIMIAAISPADVNFEESLSTLRYADRAKQIVNKAVINEDPSAKIISQLRAEIERLKAQLSGNGENATGDQAYGTTTNGISQAEYDALKEQLEQSQKLMTDMQMTTEERIKQTEMMAKEREAFLKDLNVDLNFDKNKSHISNLNEDPLLSGKLNYYIQEETTIGSSAENSVKIQGVGILDRHATFNNGNITPCIGAKIYLNGVEIKEKTKIKNGDRIVFGTHLIYQYNDPKEGPICLADWKTAFDEVSKAMFDEKAAELVKEHKKREQELQETINSVKSEIDRQRQEQKLLIQKEMDAAKQKEEQMKTEFSKKEQLLLAELQAAKNDEEKKKQIEKMLADEKKKNEEQIVLFQKQLEQSKLDIASSYQKQIMELEAKLMAELDLGKKHKEDLERENQKLQQQIKDKELEYEKKISEEKEFLQKKEQALQEEKQRREVEITKIIAENQHNSALVAQYQEELAKEKERIDNLIKAQVEMFQKSEERIRSHINSEVEELKAQLEKSKQAEEEARKYKDQLAKVEEEMSRKSKEHEELMQREKEKFSMREKELLGTLQAREKELMDKIQKGASEEEINELRKQLIQEKQEKQQLLEQERADYERKVHENRIKMTAVRAIFKTQIQKSNTIAAAASSKAEEKITLLQQKYLEEKLAQQEEIERQKQEMERQQLETQRQLAAKQSELLLSNEQNTKAMLEQMRLLELEKEERERDFQRKELEMSMKLFDIETRLQNEMAEKAQLIIDKAVKSTVVASNESAGAVNVLIPWIQEANLMLTELKKEITLDLRLVGSDISVEVTDKTSGNTEVWSRDKFETKLVEMRNYYFNMKNGIWMDPSQDPFVSIQKVSIIQKEDPSALMERIKILEGQNQQLQNEKAHILVDLNIALAENEQLRAKAKKTGTKSTKKIKSKIKHLKKQLEEIASKHKVEEILSTFDELVGSDSDNDSDSDSDNDDFDAMIKKAKSLTKTVVKGVKEIKQEIEANIPPPKSAAKKSRGDGKNQSSVCVVQ
ncbi:hypothetical protein FDP41_011836 [Naegleria fowleri]|uniref:Kinesin motor domain-containing protein n=1 Tax=Naegleria fowleri TaxID=5763 RepID=A0A6A5C9E4_NAEFO|nr:uncharacterized protein FDP41_011836 [Naegleria fowleri]KAF0981975.1 hypothetical protein FDP41_011836 [Naegleria fowleri]